MIVRSLKLALMGAAMCGASLPVLAFAAPVQAASGYSIERQDLGSALLKLAQRPGAISCSRRTLCVAACRPPSAPRRALMPRSRRCCQDQT